MRDCVKCGHTLSAGDITFNFGKTLKVMCPECDEIQPATVILKDGMVSVLWHKEVQGE